MLWLASVAGAGLLSCGPPRPSSFAHLPREVDVVQVLASEQELRQLEFLEGSAEPPREFRYQTPKNPQADSSGPEEVTCKPSLLGSAMCPSLELTCVGEKGDVRLELELRRDGLISVRLGAPSDTTPEDLVETRLLVKTEAESTASRATLAAQFAEGMIDPISLQVRGQFRKGDSLWFNQVITEGDEVFVAIHESHPHYQQVMLSLSLVGKLWAAHSQSFVDCGFSE